MPSDNERHGKNKRASFENYGRSEIAFLGTTCGVIQQTVERLLPKLSESYSVCYLDAEHGDAIKGDPLVAKGASFTASDKQGEFNFTKASLENKLFPKLEFAGFDLVLINGNHFIGSKQVLFLDKRKSDSIHRNQHKVVDILAVIDVDGDRIYPDFIAKNGGLPEDVPIYDAGDVEGLLKSIGSYMKPRLPKLKGLVLSGGKSSRMGSDKGDLNYHGVAQREYVANLLSSYCDEVRISLRDDQDIPSTYPTYVDLFSDMGPLGAILTAFKNEPDAAWLVAACDLPLIEQSTIDKLVKARQTNKEATAYKRSDAEWPEPLLAIWEPKIYSKALQILSLGIQCPRKLLINSNVAMIYPDKDIELMNANTPEERDQIVEVLRHHHAK